MGTTFGPALLVLLIVTVTAAMALLGYAGSRVALYFERQRDAARRGFEVDVDRPVPPPVLMSEDTAGPDATPPAAHP